MIDIHVHLRDGVQQAKETLEHGFTVATACGIEALFEMPNTEPPLTTPEAILERIERGLAVARTFGEHIFYGMWVGLTAERRQIKHVVELYRQKRPHIVGCKLFAGHSTGQMGLVTYQEQLEVFRALTELSYTGVVAVHAEKEELLQPTRYDAQRSWTHALARPPEAEIASVAEQIELVGRSGFSGHLHICHISTAGALDLVEQARSSGMKISCGATAHHALLDTSAAGQQWNLLKMNPPLRSAEDRNAIFEGLLEGKVDWIESDHAPHTIADKLAGASGIANFGGTLLLIEHLRAAGITEQRLAEITHQRAQEVFELKRDYNQVLSSAQISELLPKIRQAYGVDPYHFIARPE